MNISHLDFELVIRILISISLGFVIGLERELTNKSAGLRTHILVSLGSAVFTILSIYGFNAIDHIGDARIVHDPARIAAQILTGIGFIGGGAVLHYGVSITGLTTAASLWITSSIGMAVGAGFYFVAIIATIAAFLVLVLIRMLEKGFLAKFITKGARIKISVVTETDNQAEIQDWFNREFENIMEISHKSFAGDDSFKKISFVVSVFDKNPVNKVYEKLKELKNIESLTLKQVEDL